MGLLDFLTKTVGIDPGSQHLRLIYKNELIFNQTAQISIDTVEGTVSGFGEEVIRHETHQIVKPVDKVIGDFHAFEQLLREAIQLSVRDRSWFPITYKMYFCLPGTTTESAMRAYRDSAEHAGAKEVHLIHQPCSAAIGMNILFEKKDFILVDLSASKVEITAFADSLFVAETVIPFGTWRLQRAIRNYLFRKYQLEPTDEQLESILSDLGGQKEVLSVEMNQVPVAEIREVLSPYFAIIEDQMLEVLEKAGSHQRIRLILSNGFYFTGGGSCIPWLVEKVAVSSKLKYTISSNPLLDNVEGLKKVMADRDRYKDYLMP